MLTIEFEPPRTSVCSCCGTTTTALTRFVYRDGDAHAVYFASFTAGHTDRSVLVTVSLGEWGEDSGSEQRVAVALKLWTNETEFGVTVLDAHQSPWANSDFIGRTLDRQEALSHPAINEVFHITDHIVAEDTLIRAHLERTH